MEVLISPQQALYIEGHGNVTFTIENETPLTHLAERRKPLKVLRLFPSV